MFGNHFYWASIRKIHATFGNMFNNISIQRTDANGNVEKIIKVPIAYAPKRSYLVRLREEQIRNREDINIAITLPRMSFEFVGFEYRPQDKKPQLGQIRSSDGAATNQRSKMWNPVPYNIMIDLNIFAKNIDDALQIVEQILPYFGPDQNVRINELPEVPELNIKTNVQFKLTGFDAAMDYEGVIGDDQPIIWTLNFEAKTQLYSGTSDAEIIKKVIANIEANDENKKDVIITQVVNPFTANPEDVYTIDETIEEF